MGESLADQKICKSNAINGKFGGLHLAELGLTAGRQMKFGRGMSFYKLTVDQNIQFSIFV